MLVGECEIRGGFLEDVVLDGAGEAKEAVAGHELAGHPQRQHVMSVAIGLEEVLDEGFALGAIGFLLHLGEPVGVLVFGETVEGEDGFEVA